MFNETNKTQSLLLRDLFEISNMFNRINIQVNQLVRKSVTGGRIECSSQGTKEGVFRKVFVKETLELVLK